MDRVGPAMAALLAGALVIVVWTGRDAALITTLEIASAATAAVALLWAILRARRILALPLPPVELDAEASRFLYESDDVLQLRVNGPGVDQWLPLDPRVDLLVEVILCTVVRDHVMISGNVPVVVMGHLRHGQPVLLVAAPEAPRAIAALLLDLRDRTGRPPQIRFTWTEGNPAVAVIRCLLFGTGDLATVTRELLHRAEPDAKRRPDVLVR